MVSKDGKAVQEVKVPTRAEKQKIAEARFSKAKAKAKTPRKLKK